MDAITNNSSPDFKQTWRIIITEDNEEINRLIYKNLTRLGYLCIQTYNGQQTVDTVKKSEKQILILDYKLPDKNGEEVIKALREKNGSAPPFIVLTGFGDENLAVKMMKLGATDYITKVSDFIDVLGEKLERICKEQEKTEENERYQKLLNKTERLAGVGGWLWYVKQDKWVMSDNWLAIHGCSEKILTSELLIKIAHPDDVERVKTAFNKTVNKRASYEIEHRIIRQDNNEVRYIKAFGEPELDADGKVHLVAGSAMDITKQKENELLLATSREMLEEAGRIAKVGGWELDVEKQKLTWSDITKKIHEVPEDFIPNLENVVQFYPKEFRKKLESLIQRVIEKGESFQTEVPVKTAKGNHIWTYSIGNPVFENGKCIKIRGIFQDITERKIADMQLRDSEERLKVLFESSPDAIYLHTLKGKFIDGNKAAEKMLGYSREELIGKNFTKLKLLPAKYLKKAAERLLKNAQGKATGPDEFELIHRDGHKVPVEIRAFPVNIQGKKQIMGIVHDIKNRKKAEKKLQDSEEKFRSIFENSVMGIFRSTPEGKYKAVNESFARILGFSSPNQLMRKVTDIRKLYNYPEEREKLLKELADKGYVKNFEVLFNQPNNTTVWVSINAKQQQYPDGQIYYEGTIQDITQKKIAEERLQETEQRLHILADNIPDEIFIKDDQHRFLYVNPKKATSDGTTPEAMMGKTDFDFFSETAAKNSYNDDIQVLKTGEPIINKEERLTGKDGNSRWVLVTKLPRTDPFGNIVGTMGISRDITKRKIAEKELITAKEKAEESDRLKSAFLANMSHEIRTPMNGILGFTNLLKDAEISREERSDFIEIIQQSGKRMLETVNDLIDISRIETGQVEIERKEFKVKEELRKLCLFFEAEAKSKNLELKMDVGCDGREIMVNSDRNKFNSIASNLIKNAIKYTKKGSIEIGCTCNNGYFTVYVRDTGIGIPEKLQQDIFSRFVQVEQGYTRNYEGAGLGLSITKAYVEMLGGKIGVESEEGKGSTFYFSLPLPQEKTETGKTETKEDAPRKNQLVDLKKLHVLVAEDDEVSRYHLEFLLEDKVANIYFAYTGTEAIKIFQNKPEINLILMDIKMPGMDGYEAARKIRTFNKSVLIIAQTAYALEGDREKAIQAGCTDYISKPVDTDELLQKIEKHSQKNQPL